MRNQKDIINEIKRIEEDSIYSAKGHFYASQYLNILNTTLGVTASVISAIAGTSAFSQFDNHNLLAGILSMVVASLTAIITFINPNQRASEHLKVGNEYNALKNDARIFYLVKIDSIENSEAIKLLEKLNYRRNKLNQDSVQIPRWAFMKAKKGIEYGESTYSVDEDNRK